MTRRTFRLPSALAVALVGASLAALSAQRAPIVQQLAFVPYHANGISGVAVPNTRDGVSATPPRTATRAAALEALRAREPDPERIAHALAVEATMRGMAGRLGGNADEWGLAGLLHDIDLAQTRDDPARHGVVGAKLIAELGFGAAVAQAVAAHDDSAGVPRRTPMEHALYCADRAFWAIRASGVRAEKGAKPPAATAVIQGLAEKGITDRIDRKLEEACAALGLTVEELLAVSLSVSL